MDKLPTYSTRPLPRKGWGLSLNFVFLGVLVASSLASLVALNWQHESATNVPINASEILQKCRLLDVRPGPPNDFYSRSQSDRFAPGTSPTLLKNATLWTGRVSGLEIIKGDILLDKGLIKAIGDIEQSTLDNYVNLVSIDVGGAWVSPGIVDLHSHLGVDSSPTLNGAHDTNSLKGLVLPWLRSLDGINTHDDAYQLSMSGGVTTALVLPGSADAIGGQAFTIKLRPTSERTPSSMLLEPPYSLNGTEVSQAVPRWRQMKHACGENPSRVYSGTRMDTIWAFRKGYDTARKIKNEQDNYCAKALTGRWDGLGNFPEELQWEALVDVLRGRVKVHTHCYETTDIDGLVRLSNEFKFPIAAFHHAHETYLVPDLLKKAYGPTPAVALFATNARYKRESYRGSEFAPRILSDNGLRIVMKSDHPVLNSRYLLYEAQQAHYYGLPSNLALAAVTSTPAIVMGQDHRIGFLKEGYDADVVVWDSHPLALGATPKQVYVDGVSQFENPYLIQKPEGAQRAPVPPTFDKEASDALKYDGLPPLMTKKSGDVMIFVNVSSIYLRHGKNIREEFLASDAGEPGVVLVRNGSIVCSGTWMTCSRNDLMTSVQRIDLEGGSISPGLVSFGSSLGLGHIRGEPSTNDGYVLDPLKTNGPNILGNDESVIRAVDGLQYATRDALIAYRAGVTAGIVSPRTTGFLSGLSTAFSTGLPHKLADGAIIQDVVALHFTIGPSTPSISTQMAALRRLFLGDAQGDLTSRVKEVVEGRLPLVIEVQSVDIMASLIQLKQEVEARSGRTMQLTFAGAAEAHILAKEIGLAGVGVILTPSRPFPHSWSSRRILPGPPLTMHNAVTQLLSHNVTVGIGSDNQWTVRNLRFDAAWTAREANGSISRAQTLALASVNVEKLLGVNADTTDLVITKGGSLLEFEGKVVGVISLRRKLVDMI